MSKPKSQPEPQQPLSFQQLEKKHRAEQIALQIKQQEEAEAAEIEAATTKEQIDRLRSKFTKRETNALDMLNKIRNSLKRIDERKKKLK